MGRGDRTRCRRGPGHLPRLVRAALALGLVVGLGAALVAPASAQDDPYGGTSTTAPAAVSADVSCQVTVTRAEAGASVTATVADVPFGATVRLLLGGNEVGRATAPLAAQATGSPVLYGGQPLARAAETTTVAIAFRVPSLAPGDYLMTAVGPSFTCSCAAETGGRFEVLAGTITRAPSAGSLPRTGFYVVLFLGAALLLLLVGRALVEASRRDRLSQ